MSIIIIIGERERANLVVRTGRSQLSSRATGLPRGSRRTQDLCHTPRTALGDRTYSRQLGRVNGRDSLYRYARLGHNVKYLCI